MVHADQTQGLQAERSPRLMKAASPGWLFIGLALLLLHLTNPVTWGRSLPDLWYAPIGIGLALVAWFGARALWLVAFDSLLVFVQAWLTGSNSLAVIGFNVLLEPIEIGTIWWCYHRLAGCSRGLDDPRSASLFLFLVPGFGVGGFALLRALGTCLGQQPELGEMPPGEGYLHLLGAFWISRALGVLALTPFLIVLATPWLTRRRWVPSVSRTEGGFSLVSSRPSRGDWLEILGLVIGTSLVGLLLLRPQETRGMAGWQLWGVPLLLIVWASLRQGMRGGILVTATAAVFTLTLGGWLGHDRNFNPLLQSNVIAQCSTALLVAASASWIRASEARYRQVVGHIPVVLYSARVISSRFKAQKTIQGQKHLSGRLTTNTNGVRADGSAASRQQGKEERGFADVQITFVSPASQQLLGKAPEELLGDFDAWLDHVDPRDREVVVAAIGQLELQREPVTCEYRLAPRPELPQAVQANQAADSPQKGMQEPFEELSTTCSKGQNLEGQTRQGESAESATQRSGASHEPMARTPIPPHNSKIISHLALQSTERWVRDTLVADFDSDGRLEGWQGVMSDITAQRALADDLRRTTNMFHTLVANLPAGVFFVQAASGRPILVNTRARQLLGQREDSAAGLEHLPQVYRLFRHDGTPYAAEDLPVCTALRRGATCMRDDIVVHRPDGRCIPLVSWAAPLDLNGTGSPDAAVWVLEDLTAMHKAEEARRKSEAHLRAVIETIAEGLLVHDADGKIIESNPAASAILNLAPKQLRGRSLLDPSWKWLREDGTPLAREDHPVRISCRSGCPTRNVVLGLPAKLASPAAENSEESSSVRWILLNCMPLSTGNDKAIDRVVTTFADITPYRQALQVLRASEEKYRGLVETLPLMVIQLDRDGRITYVNPAAQAITGYCLDDLPEPAAWQALIHPEDLSRLRAVRADVLEGHTARLEIRYRAKDGTEKIGYAIVQPRWQEGTLSGVTALVVDMTLQRRLEQDLQRAQRLELVGRLASGIAHDFNNLLSVVLALTELARENVPADHPAYANLGRAAEAGQQAAHLAGQLLAFSKQCRVTCRRVDVNAVVRRTLELLCSTLPAGITVESDLQEGKLWVQADDMQLQQVLMNLCLNARDAMPHGGRLTLRTELETENAGTKDAADAADGTTWVRLLVQDTGHGIAEHLKDNIFDPFFSTKERGTGLGLAVVRQIVESYGGKIQVESRQGQGSRFIVMLPQDTSMEKGKSRQLDEADAEDTLLLNSL